MDPLAKVKEAASADLAAERRRALERLREAGQAELARPTPIVRWTKHAKMLAKFIATVTAVLTAAAGFWGAIRNMVARNVGPADVQKTGVASTALDRVDEPPKPKAK